MATTALAAQGWRWLPHSDAQRRSLAVCVSCMVGAPITAALVGLKVDYAALLGFGSVTGVISLFVPAIAYARFRRMQRTASAIETMLLVLAMAVPILILSYAAMRLDLPLADRRLAGWDAALGMDAGEITRAVGTAPWLSQALAYAYASFSPQILGVPLILSVAARCDDAYRFVAQFVLICAVAIAISAAFPALGSHVHFALQTELGAVDPFFGHHFLSSFHGVRDDPGFVLSPDVASGIVTFPSIHAATAVLCAVAIWPVRAARWPFALLNAAMFLSAITHGAHYAVDVLAGGAIAVLVRAAYTFRARPVPIDRDVPTGAGAAR
ncbi:phosphatase PAP2 family protein [Sphingomonas sp.]